jgi:uncharacterized lipoprotein YddW (UPF0748 family)
LFVLGSILFCSPAEASFEVVRDNNDATGFSTTGTWTTSASSGYNGTGYVYATSGNAATANWTVTLPQRGDYEVSVIYRSGTNRPTAAAYTVNTTGGAVTATADQTTNNLVWVPLGTYNLASGSNTVTLNAATSTPTGRACIADAVRWRLIQDPAEMRVAIIVVFDPVNSTSSIQTMVNEIANLKYNAVAVHARYRGDATYFPNKTDSTFPNNEPRTSAAGSVDVLHEFVTRGQAAGLKVFAYVNAYLVTDNKDTDARSNHILNQQPGWVTYHYNAGSPRVQVSADWGTEGKWIDPGIPAAQDYVANLCGDIMKNYPVDGILLDRIRYPQTRFGRVDDYGYHPTAIARFRAQYGGSGVPNPTDSNWIQFRRDQITETVRKVHETVTAINYQASVIAYPFGNISDCLNYTYQDWPTWLNQGVVDAVFPQVYITNNTDFDTRLAGLRTYYSGPRLLCVAHSAITTGIDVAGQIQIARNRGYSGVSPYRHGTTKTNNYFPAIQSKFTHTAPWPAMSWKVPKPWEARLISSSVVSTILGGETATIAFTYKNTGNNTWNSNTRLGTSNPRGRSSPFYNSSDWVSASRPTPLDQASVPPGKTGTFTFVARAPQTAGNYAEAFELIQESGTWFPGTGDDVTWNVTVQPNQPAAPTGLVATNGDGGVGLNWSANTEPNLAGYNVYRATSLVGGTWTKRNSTLLTTTQYNDLSAPNGQVYFYRVEAQNTSGVVSTPSAVVVANPHASDYILLQAEGYDVGGPNVGYSDANAGNSGGAFRNDDVDITTTANATAVTSINANEWLRFSGIFGGGYAYRVRARVASAVGGGSFKIQVNGVDAGTVTWTGATGGWDTWTVINGPTLTIPANATVRVVMLQASWNLDWVEFTRHEKVLNDDAGAPGFTQTGTWTVTSTAGYLGFDRWASTGGAHTATWHLAVPRTGQYKVEVIFRNGSNRATSVRYNVAHSAGTAAVNVDQKNSPNLTWVNLGTYSFNAGTGSVQLNAAQSSGGSVCMADCVRITYVP